MWYNGHGLNFVHCRLQKLNLITSKLEMNVMLECDRGMAEKSLKLNADIGY